MARLAVREGLQRQSDHEQFGCPSVRRLLDVYGESETPSTSGEGEHKFTESLPEVKTVEYVVYVKPVRHGADAAGASKKEKKENTKVDIAAAATA